MACRVGMSTRPWDRIEEWKKEEGHTDGKVLASGLTYDEALKREKKEADERGCCQSGGGPRGVPGKWSVYHVWGGRCPVEHE